MNGLINNCFKLESESISLNYSCSRKIKCVLDSVIPTVKITIQLVAVDHKCHVEMSKDTFYAVMEHAADAVSAMEDEDETEIYKNDLINVFTECMHDSCAICFVDYRGVRVNMMVKTFKSMANEFSTIVNAYKGIYSSINSKAANLKSIIDLIFNKMQECQLDNGAFKRYVTKIKQNMDNLFNLKAPVETVPDIDYFPSDDEDDYYEYKRKRRWGRW